MMEKTLSMIGGACLLAAALHGPAIAGDNVRVVPLGSDSRGNRAWVEIETANGRTKAQPFVAVGDEKLRKTLENPGDKGTVAIPVPRLMRAVEHARRALREMKRPAPGPAAGADNVAAAAAQAAVPPLGALETAPSPAMPLVQPEKTGAAIRPPPTTLFSAAGR